MDEQTKEAQGSFTALNKAYSSTFRFNKLSVGLVVPIEQYATGPVPTMQDHLARVQLAEELGFAAVWLRDVPFNVPSFGDAGQPYDPFVYLGYLAANTSRIALGVASIILPLRHPAHVAKAAASADVLSGGRLLLGVASGDRPAEYPAMDKPFATRGESFRSSFDYIRQVAADYPAIDNAFGALNGQMDMLPKPTAGTLPLLITGGSQQTQEWIANHGDGWMIYPRSAAIQRHTIGEYRYRVARAGRPPQPVMQPLYVDLVDDPAAAPQPIHLGFRLGTRALLDYLQALEAIGLNHIAINLRFNQNDIAHTMHQLAEDILPAFSS